MARTLVLPVPLGCMVTLPFDTLVIVKLLTSKLPPKRGAVSFCTTVFAVIVVQVVAKSALLLFVNTCPVVPPAATPGPAGPCGP